ncbi:hypothetical protein SODALDRAFT_320909 [Sodiomyces alkalinus F11]|uniref:Uncharacterized protein n=1 Tax=Sodiomyces alkalinus (strain CBS 110278 / VKM F-3762 / F11) TaxID=1314773 RepID=A0A3N2PMH1_SODAK|nr:hypothetical protein SODALDRAFT_320909 [Sodiomyces alkalinus F11]ROT35614.1 hypothetical protein SODALDRAFT_320909 [Sodiomyces alkalinus F11]
MSDITPRKTFIRIKTSAPAPLPDQHQQEVLSEWDRQFRRHFGNGMRMGTIEDRAEETQSQPDQLDSLELRASSREDTEQRDTQGGVSSLRFGSGDYAGLAGAREEPPNQSLLVSSYHSTPERDVQFNSTGMNTTAISSTEIHSVLTSESSDEDSEMSGTTDEEENHPSMQNWLPSANDQDKREMLIKMSKDMKKLRARNKRLRTQKRLKSSGKRPTSRGSTVATPATATTNPTAATFADAALTEMVSLVGEQSVRIKSLESRIMDALDENKTKEDRIEDLIYDLGEAQDSARAFNAALGHSQGQHHEALNRLRQKDAELHEMARQLQQAHDSFEQEVQANRSYRTQRDFDACTIESLRKEREELEARQANARYQLTEPRALLSILNQSSPCEKVVESVWKPLQVQVAVLARGTLRGPIPTTGMLPEFYTKLYEIWPEWEDHVDNPSIRAGVVEAYLWAQVEKYCSLGPNGVWGGSMGNAFRSVCQNIVNNFLDQENDPEKVAAYCWWRSSGAYMLSQIQSNDESTGVEQSWIDTVDHQLRVLKPLLVRSSKPDENLQAFQELRGRLEKMFYKARLLDDAFMSSRQMWKLSFPRHVDLFDSEMMARGFKVKDKDRPEAAAAATSSVNELRVRFVISPALHVLGADKEYETWTMFRKARVDCYAEGDGPVQQPRQVEVLQLEEG